ncbi:pentatricopeptide repeat-containing protein At4g21300-like [Coffea arabica]|uniref:Pentatricopeptide repeat-containing protein At4g21300-like n=1 Tax=Coffea arabica TaxID=13443 RepID=A0A6P6U7M6_COFAR|nr:pentatricopeptide repeat-containing protein At4g21300-like [Coffea arabica]
MHRTLPCSITKKFRALKTVQKLCTTSHCIHTNTEKAEEALASKLAQVLKSCNPSYPGHSNPSIIQKGQQIHAQITVNGLNSLGLLGTRVLGIYILCGKFFDAKNLFFQLELYYASPWNWMIRGFTLVGWFDFALMFYYKMLGFGTCPDKYTFPYVIKACCGLQSLRLGRLIHGSIRDLGFELDVFVGSALIKLYAENGCIGEARRLFDKMPEKDSVLWNVMLNAYAQDRNLVDDVIGLYREMRMTETKPNSISYACILSVCGSEHMVYFGAQVHGNVVRCGLEMESSVANTLIAMYAKCQCLSDARKLFDLITQADFVTWNAMIGGYVQSGHMPEALDLFCQMLSVGAGPDSTTFTSILSLFSEFQSLNQAKEIHGYILRNNVNMDVFLKNALIDIYFKCRAVKMASKIFNCCPAVDIVICTAMISGFVLNGMDFKALEMFRWVLDKKMRPNAVTLASLLPACAGLAALKLGRELHGSILRNGLEDRCFVGSSISDMYAKCGRLDLARLAFFRISKKDTVSWNSMITSCCQNAKPEEAIDLFYQMRLEGAKYDSVSLSAALCACANLQALCYGKVIHGFMIRGAFSSDLFAESALIDMYAKCGHLELASTVFDMMECKNEVSWNSIIAAYGNHGHLEDALALLNEMRDDGFQPDHVTFLAIISACSHTGQVEEGKQLFEFMTQELGITARMEHYACLIDLFGRAGCLEEAHQVVRTMPFTADAGIWGTLLGACRVHGNIELAELASNHLFDLDPQNSGYYMLLSHVHADTGKWEGVNKVRNMMKERGVQKVPGYSWLEVNQSVHMFVAADTDHPQSSEIYLLLRHLLRELHKEGYVPQYYHPMHRSKFTNSCHSSPTKAVQF